MGKKTYKFYIVGLPCHFRKSNVVLNSAWQIKTMRKANERYDLEISDMMVTCVM